MRMDIWQVRAAAKIIDGCDRNARCEWEQKEGDITRTGIMRGITAKSGGFTRTIDDAAYVWITTTDTGTEVFLPVGDVIALMFDYDFNIETEEED
jgi:hypothetical protein